MSQPGREHKTAVLIAIALVAAVVVAVVVDLIWDFDPLAFLSVAATLAIAFLTVAYVLVTSGQLAVMRQQLDEMTRTRELGAQPLPYVAIKAVFLERPRVYRSPPTDSYPAGARLVVEYELRNEGSQPAVNIVSDSHVHSDGADQVIRLGAREIGVLAPGVRHPTDASKTETMSTTAKHTRTLISTLRDRSYRQPVRLCFRVLYRNLLGACFAEEWRFVVMPQDDEDFPTLTNWESHLVSFDVEHKEDIARLRTLQERDPGRWRTEFDVLCGSFDESLVGGEKLELSCRMMPNSYSARILDKDEYQAAVKSLSFGHPIPKWAFTCPALGSTAQAPQRRSAKSAGQSS